MFDVLEQCPPDQSGIVGVGIASKRGQNRRNQRGVPVYGAGADIAIACKPRAEPLEAFGKCCGHRSLFQGFDPVEFDKMLEEPLNFRHGSNTRRTRPLTKEHPRN